MHEVETSKEGAKELYESVLSGELGRAGKEGKGEEGVERKRSWVMPYRAIVLLCQSFSLIPNSTTDTLGRLAQTPRQTVPHRSSPPPICSTHLPHCTRHRNRRNRFFPRQPRWPSPRRGLWYRGRPGAGSGKADQRD